MEKQAKLLDKQYLTTRLNEFKEIKRGEVQFAFHESDRAFSKTLYIDFFIPDQKLDKKWGTELRISDHQVDTNIKNQLIIDFDACLDKGTKQKFMGMVKRCICGAKRKNLSSLFDQIRGTGNEDRADY